MATVAQLKAILTLNTAQFNRSIGRLSQSIRTMGLEMKKTGRQMTRWITLPMVAVGTTAATAAAKTDSAMKQLRVAVGASREEMERVEQATKDVAKTTGLAMDKVVKAQKLAQSSQLDTAEANELVASTAKLAASGYGNMERQVNFATTATLKFGDEISNATEALEIAGQTAQKVQIRIGEFIPQFQRALSPMNQLNISLREGAALFAGLADAAGNVNQAGTQFRRLLIALQQPSQSLQKVIEKQFDSFEKFKTALGKNAFKALRKLKKGMDASDKSMKDLLGRINAVIGAGNLFTGNMQRAKDALVETGEAAGFIERVFKRSSTSIREMNKAWNKIRFAIEPLGAEILPIVVRGMNRTARAAQDLSKWFAGLSQETKNSIVFWSEIATVAGPVVLIFGQLALGLSRIITLMRKTGNLIVWVSGLVKNLTSGLWALFNISVKIKALRLAVHIKRIASAITTAAVATWGWVAPIAAVVGVAALLAEAAVLISQNWGKLTTFFNKWTQGFQNMMFDVGQWVVGLFNGAVEGIAEGFRWVANKVKDFFKPVLDWLISMFITTLKKINEAATSLIRHLARAASFVDEGLSLSLSSAADNLQKNVNKLRKVQEEGLAVGPSIKSALESIKEPAEFAATFYEEKAREVKNSIKDFTKAWAKEISSTARITFEEAWKTVKIANKKALKDLRNQFQQFGFFTGDAESMGVFSPKLTKRQNALVSGDVAGALFEANKARGERAKMVDDWMKQQKEAAKQQKKVNDAVENTGKKAKEARVISKKNFKKIAGLGQNTATILRNEFAGFSGAFSDELDRAEQRMVEFAAKAIESLIKIAKATEIVGQAQDVSGSGGTAGAIAGIVSGVISFFGDTPGPLKARRGNLASFKKGDFVAASQTKEGLREQVNGGKRANKSVKKKKEKDAGTVVNMTTNVNVAMGVDAAAEAAIKRRIPDIQEAVESGIVKKLGSGGGKLHTAIRKAQ